MNFYRLFISLKNLLSCKNVKCKNVLFYIFSSDFLASFPKKLYFCRKNINNEN